MSVSIVVNSVLVLMCVHKLFSETLGDSDSPCMTLHSDMHRSDSVGKYCGKFCAYSNVCS